MCATNEIQKVNMIANVSKRMINFIIMLNRVTRMLYTRSCFILERNNTNRYIYFSQVLSSRTHTPPVFLNYVNLNAVYFRYFTQKSKNTLNIRKATLFCSNSIGTMQNTEKKHTNPKSIVQLNYFSYIMCAIETINHHICAVHIASNKKYK